MAAALQQPDVSYVTRADVPTEAASPHPLRDGAIGLVLGFAVAAGLLLLVDAHRRRP